MSDYATDEEIHSTPQTLSLSISVTAEGDVIELVTSLYEGELIYAVGVTPKGSPVGLLFPQNSLVQAEQTFSLLAKQLS